MAVARRHAAQFVHKNLLVETRKTLAEANEEEADSEARYERVVAASLLALGFVLRALKDDTAAVHAPLQQLLSHAPLWKLHRMPAPQVRSAFNELLAAVAASDAGVLDEVLKPAAAAAIRHARVCRIASLI